MNHTIAGRMTVAVIAAHLVVLPVLCFALIYLLKENNESQFLDYVRGYTRFIAERFEQIELNESDELVSAILDGVLLSGSGVYADLQLDDKMWSGSLGDAERQYLFIEDFSFGEHKDSVYYLSAPVEKLGSRATLRLGFDEVPVTQQNQAAYLHVAAILATYLLVISLLAAWFGFRVTRPVRALQKLSRSVASGHFQKKLFVETDLVEFAELSKDLEKMRRRLTQANQLLQKEIKDRAMLQSQLHHRQRIETVGTLAGGIAHELNNMLVPILLYIDMAIEDLPVTSSSLENLQRAVASANRAKNIVSQVLAFSHQIDETNLVRVDLRAIIAESLVLILPTLPADIRLTHDVSCSNSMIIGEPAMLTQMVVNLCTNAYQSMGANGGDLRIEVACIDLPTTLETADGILPASEYIKLMVSDTGEGIEEFEMERIFEPFYSTRAIGSGTGLGLSLVHGIVTALHGGIVVNSKPSEGSCFEIYLPSADSRSGQLQGYSTEYLEWQNFS